MALSTYAELQTAVRAELAIESSGLPDASIVDAINRAESRMNRKLRLREMEQLTTDTLAAGTNTISLPAGFLELIGVQYKAQGAADSSYLPCHYVAPDLVTEYYAGTSKLRYTLRDELEFIPTATSAYTIRLHWLKRLDLATDGTNWVLTHHPDVYFYGALSELERTMRNDERMPIWRADFEAAIEELNEVAHRGRDDAQLITREVASLGNSNSFNISRG